LLLLLSAREVMEVNFMGAVVTSQAFIPLLRGGQQKGRIINVSSVVSSRGPASQLASTTARQRDS
jgi:NAD(P)-dependent dehydrogenase (short-subunit alcohol dehydrogenase family)